MRVLALNIGTSCVQAAVLDVQTTRSVGPVGRSTFELDHPTADAAEVPAERLWTAVTRAARDATWHMDGVAAVGLACASPALLLLDAADQPLKPIWTHLDRRARPAARQTWAAVGEEFHASTGNRPLPGGITALSYRQLLIDDPYLHRKVKTYLHVNGWLGFRLTGVKAFDPANACFTGLGASLTERTWSERWCSFFEVEQSWLPPIHDGSSTLGSLRPDVAAELGIPAGVPVKLGTADIASAMLAAGAEPGDLMHCLGTTQLLAALTDRPRSDPRRLTQPLGVGKLFMHITQNPVGGVALDWLRALCFRDVPDKEYHERLVPEAIERGTRVTLDPPYLGGDRLEIEAYRAAFRDLTLATDRMDLLAAVLEAMRRKHRDALAALGLGTSFRRVFLTGPGAETFPRLLPEYAGVAVQVVEDATLRGVARLFQSDSV